MEELAIKSIAKIAAKAAVAHPVTATVVGVAAVIGVVVIACKKISNQSNKQDEDNSYGNKKGTVKQSGY